MYMYMYSQHYINLQQKARSISRITGRRVHQQLPWVRLSMWQMPWVVPRLVSEAWCQWSQNGGKRFVCVWILFIHKYRKCVYIYIYINIWLCVHMYVCTCMYIIYLCVRVSLKKQVHAHVHVWMFECMRAFVFVQFECQRNHANLHAAKNYLIVSLWLTM